MWEPYLFLQSSKLATSNLVYNWFGSSLPERTIRTKIRGVLGYGSIQKCGSSYLFQQPLKLLTSHLVYNLRWGVAYQESTCRTKTGGGGAAKKLPCLFLQPLNFKFGTQLRFEE